MSQTLTASNFEMEFVGNDKETHFRSRVFDAVTKKYGRTGLTLTLPIFCSDNRYRFACERPARRSMCVNPPSASEIHISCPCGGRSTEVIKVSSVANTSEAMPEARDSVRIVQSYAVVYT